MNPIRNTLAAVLVAAAVATSAPASASHDDVRQRSAAWCENRAERAWHGETHQLYCYPMNRQKDWWTCLRRQDWFEVRC